MAEIIMGKVVKIIDEYRIVINKGRVDGVVKSNRFLVYRLGEELFDPDTDESLGVLEIVCGEGKPEHIQDHLTTLYTSKQEIKKTKTVIKHGGLSSFYGGTEETYDPETYDIPFNDVGKDCIAKQIK